APMPRDSKSSTSIVDQLFPRVSQPVVRYGLRVRQARRVAQIGAPWASAALPRAVAEAWHANRFLLPDLVRGLR
ncbi:hypothetical protein ACV34Z_35200, partial [Pseudomonas aeruginosa]